MRRRLRTAVVLGAVLAGVVACTNDFDKFESADGQGTDPLAQQDASSANDATAPPSDGSASDVSAPTDGGGDACSLAASCEATMTTCHSSCEQTQTTCLDKCTSNSCRRQCRQ